MQRREGEQLQQVQFKYNDDSGYCGRGVGSAVVFRLALRAPGLQFGVDQSGNH